MQEDLREGARLGQYKIVSGLGAGGMGKVYRAIDSRLGREVALKVLPADQAQDTVCMARFEREARLLASLNHPHIAQVYGFEKGILPDGSTAYFLAMELVEGEELSVRLLRGAIPLDEVLPIACQIAEGLEEAHQKGIIHRDLKPGNVKLTSDGQVKILDFGLAKLHAGKAEASSPASNSSEASTLKHADTAPGSILGTPAYMSPEQARGKPVDSRTDIWAFGAVLYEMLTGVPLFDGDTSGDVLAGVLTREPDFQLLPPNTPRAVRLLLRRCLRKELRTRLPDIAAARFELQDLIDGVSTEAEEPWADVEDTVRTERRRRGRERSVWAAAALILVSLAVLIVQRPNVAHEVRSAAHIVLATPDDLAFSFFSPIALSPDGLHLAFIGVSSSGESQMWLGSLASPETRAVPGTLHAKGGFFWSPDSTSIAFASEGVLRMVTLATGTVRRICALPQSGNLGDHFNGGTWNVEGTIVFAFGWPNSRLYVVSDKGGEATPLTSHDESRGETGHWWPQFLPDGRRLLLLVSSTEGEHAGLHGITLEAHDERQKIRPEAARFQFVAPGYLLFVQNGTLLAQRFDPEDLVTIGGPFSLASEVAVYNGFFPNWGWFSASATGRLTWLSGEEHLDVQPEWIDREGRHIGSLGEPGQYRQIALSPDDRRFAVEIRRPEKPGGQYNIWVGEVARGVLSRLTTDSANEQDPVWSPNSQEIVFSSGLDGLHLLRKGLQGSEPAAPLPGVIGHMAKAKKMPEDWFQSGNTIVYRTRASAMAGPASAIADPGQSIIWTLSLDGGEPPVAVMKSRFHLDEPQVSPGGRWLAYISEESGRWEVYVKPFQRGGETVRVSSNRGGQPKWRGDGKELFYLSSDGAMMAVSIGEGKMRPEVGIPEVLVSANALKDVVQGPDYDDYAVTSDGRRFLVKRRVGKAQGQRLHVLFDWPSLLD